jgi:hypothetical protein
MRIVLRPTLLGEGRRAKITPRFPGPGHVRRRLPS